MYVRLNALPRVGLGALTDQQVLDQQGFTATLHGGSSPIRRQTYQQAQQALASGQLPFNQGSCKPTSQAGAVLSSQAGQVTLKFAGASGPAAPFLVVAGIGLAIFGALWKHHAQQVAKETAINCAATPAANEALRTIDNAVRSGQITPQQGIAALDQLYSDFRATVAPVFRQSSTACNWACGATGMLAAIITKWKSQYAEMQAAQPVTPAQFAGKPPWLPWAVAAGLIYALAA